MSKVPFKEGHMDIIHGVKKDVTIHLKLHRDGMVSIFFDHVRTEKYGYARAVKELKLFGISEPEIQDLFKSGAQKAYIRMAQTFPPMITEAYYE
jgi:hypothetical protein